MSAFLKSIRLGVAALVLSVYAVSANAGSILFAHVADYSPYVNDGNAIAGYLSNAGHTVTTRYLNQAVWNDYNSFDQVFVYDLSHQADLSSNQVANYNNIGNWYNGLDNKNLILDGRIISSAPSWTPSSMPSEEAWIQNYATQLQLRGGGLVLGTDHNAYHSGINTINSVINVNPFYGYINQYPYQAFVDPNSPLAIPGLATCLTDPSQICINDNSSTGIVATNLQANGQLLTPVAYHGTGTSQAWDQAAVSTTMGSITFDTCGGAGQPACSVPEPSSPILFGLGLLMLGLQKRRGWKTKVREI